MRTCRVLQCCSNGLGFARPVELEVDHDVAGIVCGAHDTVASDARGFVSSLGSSLGRGARLAEELPVSGT
jgi:hypothetical protein